MHLRSQLPESGDGREGALGRVRPPEPQNPVRCSVSLRVWWGQALGGDPGPSGRMEARAHMSESPLGPQGFYPGGT